jgi:hypothetical protein
MIISNGNLACGQSCIIMFVCTYALFILLEYGIPSEFNKKKNLFTSKLDLNLRKKLVKCCIWSMALYGAETWTIRAVDQKHVESFEMW